MNQFMDDKSPILIIGAGPTGLAMALFLHNLGLPFRIIEKNKEISKLSRALALQPRTLEIFDMLGLVDEFLHKGHPVDAINFHLNHKPIAQVSYKDLNTSYPYPLIIPQNETEKILSQALKERKVKIERGTELLSLYAGGERPSALIQKENGKQEELHPSYIIGCDGAHSTVRKQCGFSFDGHEYPESFSLADATVSAPYSHSDMHIFIGSTTGAVALFPLPEDKKVRIVVSHSPTSNEAKSFLQMHSGDTPGTFTRCSLTQEQMEEYLKRHGITDLKIEDVAWLSDFHIHKRIASKWRRRSAFIAGDAAHIHSPMGGQGLNTGVQDAWNLSWKLKFVIEHGAHSKLLDTYQKERHYAGSLVLKVSDRITRLAVLKNKWLIRMRNWLLCHIAPRPFFSCTMAKQLSELFISYPSSICVEKDYFRTEGPSPGMRALDHNFEKERLYRLIATDRFTCLIFTGLDRHPGRIHEALKLKRALDSRKVSALIISIDGHIDESAVTDVEGQCHKLYGAKGPLLSLVRPDGYVALVHEKIEKEPIENYLRGLF